MPEPTDQRGERRATGGKPKRRAASTVGHTRGKAIPSVIQQFFDENTTTIRSQSTRAKWARELRLLQKRYPNKRLNEFRSDDLRNFLVFDRDGSPREVAGGTILGERTCLRSFFSWCEHVGLVEKDPSAELVRTLRVTAQPTRKHHWLNHAEVSALFDACNADVSELRGARDGIALGLGVFCGLRCHEIAKIAWGEVNLRSGQLFVLGKGGKAATLPMPPQLVDLLTEWQRRTAAGLGRPVSDGDAILNRMQSLGGPAYGGERAVQMLWGKPIGNAGILQIVHGRGAEIGLPDLAPHDLRRTFAGILEEGNVSIRDISKLLRHSSVATTERYLADNPSQWKQSVSRAMMGITTTSEMNG